MFFLQFICIASIIIAGQAFLKPRTTISCFHGILSSNIGFKAPPAQYFAKKEDDSPMDLIRSPIKLNPTTVLLNPKIDVSSILAIFLGQSLLLIIILMLEIFTNFNLMPSAGYLSFNLSSISSAFIFSLPLVIGGWILDTVSPIIYRNTKTFSLRLLGYSTTPIIASFTAFVLSFCAGLSEEIFFRGFLFSVLQKYSNLWTAWLGSAIIFGLAHYPFILGPQAVFETFLGLYFAFVYWFSGYNLAIPILVHTIYDFVTLFGTWIFTAKQLQHNIAKATERTKLMPINEPELFKETCRLVRKCYISVIF